MRSFKFSLRPSILVLLNPPSGLVQVRSSNVTRTVMNENASLPNLSRSTRPTGFLLKQKQAFRGRAGDPAEILASGPWWTEAADERKRRAASRGVLTAEGRRDPRAARGTGRRVPEGGTAARRVAPAWAAALFPPARTWPGPSLSRSGPRISPR